jgi:hypothetical protein
MQIKIKDFKLLKAFQHQAFDFFKPHTYLLPLLWFKNIPRIARISTDNAVASGASATRSLNFIMQIKTIKDFFTLDTIYMFTNIGVLVKRNLKMSNKVNLMSEG